MKFIKKYRLIFFFAFVLFVFYKRNSIMNIPKRIAWKSDIEKIPVALETVFHPALDVHGNLLKVESSFVPVLLDFLNKAKELGLMIHITSSFRTSTIVPGAIVTPAQKSNHLVGHAFDCNIIDSNGRFLNSTALNGVLPTSVQSLIDFVRMHPVLRWGGDFVSKDSVHFDDNLNNLFPVKWQQIYETLQIHS